VTKLYHEIQSVKLQEGQIALAWLGQSGYLIKAYPESYLIIDPYLTNYCEEQLGLLFKRLMPPALELEELCQLPLTAYLITHHHQDHYDPNIIRALESSGVNTAVPFYTSPTTIQALIKSGVQPARCSALAQGTQYNLSPYIFIGTFADHGDLAPDAVGILIEVNGRVIYHMGDTSFNPEQFAQIGAAHKVDILIPPINGRYGNLNTEEAVQTVSILKPAITTPAHFWMLPANSGGNPAQFAEGVNKVLPDCRVLLMQQGEIAVL
jgi:L-ascorbate 6-phosphate lactonase